MKAAVQISRIFPGILPDGNAAGLPAVFVLLAGCEISCQVAGIAPHGPEGERRAIDEIIPEVLEYGLRHTFICGGEPLLQEHCLALADELLRRDFTVILEANATVEFEGLDPRIIKSLDFKCPSNGSCTHINWSNLRALKRQDCARFYVADRGDYVWARDVIRRENLAARLRIFLLPMPGGISADMLAKWILVDRLEAQLQVPLAI